MEPARLRASPEQFSALIEYMERHGDLARPQTGSQGRLRADRLWQELASLLNSIGGGVEKTQDKWKKIQSQINEDPITEDERNEVEIYDINLTLPPEPPLTLLLGPEATTTTQSPLLRTSRPSADRQAPLSSQTVESPRRQRLLRAQRNRGLTHSDRAAFWNRKRQHQRCRLCREPLCQIPTARRRHPHKL